MRNMVLAALRRGSRIADLDAHEVVDRAQQTTWSSPERHLEAVEALRAVRELPERYRDAVVLATEGYSVREIAQALRIFRNRGETTNVAGPLPVADPAGTDRGGEAPR
ncbi:DNA-directed RNA polymerase specialized sigma24 family protein [Amycolatopsis endophytica]|uniref:DNA-directed RNA polymerase specialized sigma24 family protein n=2 Tax=Amycolatopsis endophytica TaxID=860233 RepID=A0A853B8X1_9PSEU|nr:DNA-directed RNA polymerase specialized sigma24 family protein [Amycolatopsis endophytica]